MSKRKKANIKEVEKYDIIVLGGGIYAMGIAGLSFLKRNINVLSDKKIIVFFCCASPYDGYPYRSFTPKRFKSASGHCIYFICSDKSEVITAINDVFHVMIF